MIVGGIGGRLDEENILPADIFLDLDKDRSMRALVRGNLRYSAILPASSRLLLPARSFISVRNPEFTASPRNGIMTLAE